MLNIILAQAAQKGMLMQMLPLALVFVVIYFFMIRPQSKKQKEVAKFRNELKVGDKVVTAGGIYGKITGIKENKVLIQIDTDTRIKVDKASILKDYSEAENQK
ncbi:preprotein translocase subunit YajC [Halosquirtibacter laminarini]|uniref:Preprotein translocase subunit YajC n=1 Tax=Halosquirtibacter laminarini TaxID=3374600 RepID=A0AC61NP62_9BACT|nr:preprotein translocase subunit YajC [Prolixibacteraceae bacterium]